MLEEDVLVGGKLVHRFAEGIGDGQRGRARTAIVHAGVAVARDPQAQVERALTAHSEAQIGVMMASFGDPAVWISMAPRSSENMQRARPPRRRDFSVTWSSVLWQTRTVPPRPSEMGAV